MPNRKSGILLHITSLPGAEGIGTLGKNAFRFVDFLKKANQKMWQILPLGQVGYGDSPYQCYSAFAGNVQLIDLTLFVDKGLLQKKDLKFPKTSEIKTEFIKVSNWKMPLLQKAFLEFEKNFNLYENEYKHFLKEHNWWLSDFALFMACKTHFKGEVWNNLARRPEIS